MTASSIVVTAVRQSGVAVKHQWRIAILFDKGNRLRYNGLMNEDPQRAAGREQGQGERMQRIRVGLTGLAVVLLIVALATVVFRRIDGQAGAGLANNSAQAQTNPDDEPLAQLGVAPGASTDDSTGNESR
jgi:hypothetical protein